MTEDVKDDEVQAGEEGEVSSKKGKAKVVKMVRDESFGEPLKADVHPDEVVNYQGAGWQVAK